MASKQENKLINLAGKLRRLKFRVQNFFYYRLLVTSKHVLIVGGDNSYLKEQIIKNFNDTWRIAHIDYQINESQQKNCHLNIGLDLKNNFIQEEELQQIDEKISKFSKHYECIICLPDNQEQSKISDRDLFQKYDRIYQNSVQMSVLAGYLASKYLTTNGILMMRGDQKSFEGPFPENLAYSIAMNQINYLNLSMGDRDDIDIDAFSVSLLEREYKIWNDENESKNMVKLIRMWAEGRKRPVSGTFIKFHQKNNKLFPEYI